MLMSDMNCLGQTPWHPPCNAVNMSYIETRIENVLIGRETTIDTSN